MCEVNALRGWKNSSQSSLKVWNIFRRSFDMRKLYFNFFFKFIFHFFSKNYFVALQLLIELFSLCLDVTFGIVGLIVSFQNCVCAGCEEFTSKSVLIFYNCFRK